MTKDKLIGDMLKQHYPEKANRDFDRRVMASLPTKEKRRYGALIIQITCLIAIALIGYSIDSADNITEQSQAMIDALANKELPPIGSLISLAALCLSSLAISYTFYHTSEA